MCFTLIIKNKNNQTIGEEGFYILVKATAENYKQNNDGFALRYDSTIIRTLHFHDFINHVFYNKEKIKNSKIIHLHLRKSTNVVCEEYIHLWNVGNYCCSHNGILHNFNQNNNENDSLMFFRSIENYLNDDNIKKIRKKIQKINGYGVFLLSNAKNNKIILISKNKSIKVYLTKNNNIVFCSDYFLTKKIDNKIEFDLEFKNKIKFLFFEFETENKKTITFEFDNVDLDYLKSEKENFISLIDFDNNFYKISEIKTDNNNYLNYYYYNNNKYYKYYYQ